MEKDYPGVTVIVAALALMMLVQIVGQLVKPIMPHEVSCSITIEHSNRVFTTYVGVGKDY